MIVMHSYDGLVGSEAISEEVSLQSCRQSSLPSGFSRLFYFAAFVLDKGQSALVAFRKPPNDFVTSNWRYTMKDTAS